jgi:ATP/maltotriose-dependent transcriptional regulator MalT
MARPMIATKLYVPKLRRALVTRPRLLERLHRGGESRLTLVSAPAGFGKTTLLAEWLGEKPGEDRSVAWLSLDPSDNEPSSFWMYVVTALQTAVPGVGSANTRPSTVPVAEHLAAAELQKRTGAGGSRSNAARTKSEGLDFVPQTEQTLRCKVILKEPR